MEYTIKVISNGFLLCEENEDDIYFPTLHSLMLKIAEGIRPYRETQGYKYKIGEIDPIMEE